MGRQVVLTPRFAIVGVLSTGILAVISAIPTEVIPNPWFTRMTPVYADQYFYWGATSLFAGILVATYFTGNGMARAKSGLSGGALGYLAIGCPICNKVVVALLGVSGAMNYFAPVQPYLGALGLLLIVVALLYRVRDLRRGACRVPAT